MGLRKMSDAEFEASNLFDLTDLEVVDLKTHEVTTFHQGYDFVRHMPFAFKVRMRQSPPEPKVDGRTKAGRAAKKAAEAA